MTAQLKATIKSYFETWKNIPGYEPYQVSDLGRIRNGDNILKPQVGKSRGHLVVYVGGGRKGSKKSLHRLVLMAFAGMPEKGQIACHKNDIKTDNRLENLYWGTHKDNTADAIRNGKFSFANPKDTTLYDNEIINKIRAEYTGKKGEQSMLARKYGMHVSNVHLIVHNKTRVV